MTQEYAAVIPPTREILCRKSWTAFVTLWVWSLIVIVVGVLIGIELHWYLGFIALIPLCFIAFRFASLRAIVVYCDAAGVWMFRGLFPWNRGVIGVKWRDLEQATYQQSFFSWVTKSYHIRIGHRFTRTSELVLNSMGHGDKAAIRVNAMLQELSARGALS